jgi:glycosyltransferase involved in cell wall biosynthesis
LFIVPSLSVGGAERLLVGIASSLDRADFHVSVVCTGEEGELFNRIQENGITAKALHAGGKRSAPRALYRVFMHIRNMQPDIVIVHGAGSSLIGRLGAMLNNVPHRIAWIHNSIDRRNSVQRLADRVLIPATTTYLGVAHTQREFMAEVCRYPTGKIRIIHSGVDLGTFRFRTDRTPLTEFGFEPGTRVVGMVARLHPVKDHETFISAAAKVLESLPDSRFLIVGDGPRRPELEALCRERGLGKQIVFTGIREDIGQLLSAMDALVLSSHSESLPLAVLEAMACGLPVVCTDVGGAAEIIEHGVSGFLTPPGDADELSSRLDELLTNADLARRMGLAGRRRVESRFDLAETVISMEEFFKGLEWSAGASDPD